MTLMDRQITHKIMHKIMHNKRTGHLGARAGLYAALLAALLACSDDGAAPPIDEPGVADGPCAVDTRIGGFETALGDGFTSVQGTIADGVTPIAVPEVVATEGACHLLRPPTLFCDPGCTPGQTCDGNGTCIAAPVNISVGDVAVQGLKSPVSMTANPPVFFYTNLGTLEHPGFDEGDALHLRADGNDEVAGFTLDALGVAELALIGDAVMLESGVPVLVQWQAPAQSDVGAVHIDLNIAQHGGTPGWIECSVPDTGEFELPIALTDQLLAGGYSGYPSIAVTRRSADRIDTEPGCIDWRVQSVRVAAVEIPGLISCSIDDDCPEGQTCQGDLTCG